MSQLYSRLRSLLRGHEREVLEYIVATTLLFVIGLKVISTYVELAGLDEKSARVATSATMFSPAFLAMLVVRRRRHMAIKKGAERWSSQRIAMSVVPHMLYVALVGAVGLPYLEVQLVIGVIWGVFIALPINYLICHRWSLKEIERP